MFIFWRPCGNDILGYANKIYANEVYCADEYVYCGYVKQGHLTQIGGYHGLREPQYKTTAEAT